MNRKKPVIKRKYLVRILASTMISILVCVAVLSGILIFQSEKQIMENQNIANVKIISMVDYNVSYMKELVYSLGIGVYFDSDLRTLLFTKDVAISDIYQKIYKLQTIGASNTFVDSVIFYNSYANAYITNKAVIKDATDPRIAVIDGPLKNDTDLVKQQLIPIKSQDGRLATFATFLYESSGTYKSGESALILSIKPEWLINSIKSINSSVDKKNSKVFVLDKDNAILLGDDTAGLNIADMIKHIDTSGAADQHKWVSGVYTNGSEKEIVDISALNANSWRIMIVQPYNDVFGSLLQTRMTLIMTILAFLVIALLFTYFISVRLYRPVGDMLKVITGAGKEAHPDFVAKDEFKYVSDLYNSVVGRLGDAERDQQDKNKIVQNFYLKKIIMDSSSISSAEYERIARENNLNIASGLPILVCILQIDDFSRYYSGTSPAEKAIIKSNIAVTAAGIISPVFPCDVADIHEDHLVLLASTGKTDEKQYEQMKGLITQVQESVLEACSISISAAVSSIVLDSTQITMQYHLCIQAIHHKLVFGHKSIIFTNAVKENMSKGQWAISDEVQRKIVECIKTADNESLKKMIDMITDEVKHCHYNCILQAMLQLSLLIQNTLHELNALSLQPVMFDSGLLGQNIMEMETLDEISKYLYSLCDLVAARQKDRNEEREDILVDTIRQLIEVNYRDPNFSLNQIAEMLKMSPAYLGRVFRRNSTLGIGDFINDVRLEHAAELLLNTDYTVKDIVKKVGYLFESYFCKLFKAKYGVTPKEYRTVKSMKR